MYTLTQVNEKENELVFADGSKIVFERGPKGLELVYDLTVMQDKIGQPFDLSKVDNVPDVGVCIDGVLIPCGLRSSDGRFVPWTEAETFP